ncbi:MAG: xylene monooxygenase [Chitinophagaceae bacterium]|nr:MAG: xylene monooxygenase [Chitinophagaceae bacterium]
MKYTYKSAAIWLVIYLFLALLPLLLAVTGSIPEYRDFGTELGVAFGFIGLGLLGLQFLISGRFKQVAPKFGMDNILQYHREMGIIAFVLILAHPLTLILSNSDFLSFFNPYENLPRALALIFVIPAIILLMLSSLWRLSLGLSYENWRLLHGVLSLSIIFIGLTHTIQVSHYIEPLWKKTSLVVLFAFYAYLLLHSRLIRPWLNLRKPYKVKEVVEERGDCSTLHLEPVGHKGKSFKCGQFMWITIGNTPFSLQQHPFSIASDCLGKTISLTAKAMGDFTSKWKDIKPGTTAYLEGPYGSFTPEKGKNLFMISGGIGITAMMSTLRTMRKEKDMREVVLIYGNSSFEEITFREELEDMSKLMNLQLVLVLEETPDDWGGEECYIDSDKISKYFPSNPDTFAFYICGPMPMQDAAELSLRDLGVDWRLIYSERYKII